MLKIDNMITIVNYNIKHLIIYSTYIFSLFLVFIFFGTKKNKKRETHKIFPLMNSDEELGLNNKSDYEKSDEYFGLIPLNCSIINKKEYLRKTDSDNLKIKIE
jgi:hypothetical protein